MKKAKKKTVKKEKKLPIKHWSYSSLMAFLRNPLAWHKRYVEKIYDTPRTPASVVGSAGHCALEHFYSGAGEETAIRLGLEYIKKLADFEINFGRHASLKARRHKRAAMEREYLQAINFYLTKPPRHKVVAVEAVGLAAIEGLALPIKAISDLVVESRVEKGSLDIVDHKFVDNFSKNGAKKTLFVIQAIFNYYIIRELFRRPVRCFMVYECKKSKNKNGGSQLRRYVIDYKSCADEFILFHRLLADATAEIARERLYLPNPSDMFEGENSFDIYRLGLVDGEEF